MLALPMGAAATRDAVPSHRHPRQVGGATASSPSSAPLDKPTPPRHRPPTHTREAGPSPGKYGACPDTLCNTTNSRLTTPSSLLPSTPSSRPTSAPPPSPRPADKPSLLNLRTYIAEAPAFSDDEVDEWIEHAEAPPSPMNSPVSPAALTASGSLAETEAFSLSLSGRLALARQRHEAVEQEEGRARGA